MVSDCGGVLVMLDDPLSLLSAIIWLAVLGTWPVGFLFGTCSACCDSCDWIISFDRCLRVSYVGSDPPSGIHCKVVMRRVREISNQILGRRWTTALFMTPISNQGSLMGPFEIHAVPTRVEVTIRLLLSAAGASRTPVGETRNQIWRFMVNDFAAGLPASTYDIIGPPWHLQVDLSVTGVAEPQEAGVLSSITEDEHGQPKLVLAAHQWQEDIEFTVPVTLLPTGVQRWGPVRGGTGSWQSFPGTQPFSMRRLFFVGSSLQSVLNATLVSGDTQTGWSVAKTDQEDFDEQSAALALRVYGYRGGLCNPQGTRTNISLKEKILFDQETILAFLRGESDLRAERNQVGVEQEYDFRVTPENALCQQNARFINTGIALGIYPDVIYADAPSSAMNDANWCGKGSATLPMFASGIGDTCATFWSMISYIRPYLGFFVDGGSPITTKVVGPKDFWAGDSLIWNVEYGPYRESFVDEGPALNGLASSASYSKTAGWTYRISGSGSNLEPLYLAPLAGGFAFGWSGSGATECRSGFSPAFSSQSRLCAPSSVTVTLPASPATFLQRTIIILSGDPGQCEGNFEATQQSLPSLTVTLDIIPPGSISGWPLLSGTSRFLSPSGAGIGAGVSEENIVVYTKNVTFPFNGRLFPVTVVAFGVIDPCIITSDYTVEDVPEITLTVRAFVGQFISQVGSIAEYYFTDNEQFRRCQQSDTDEQVTDYPDQQIIIPIHNRRRIVCNSWQFDTDPNNTYFLTNQPREASRQCNIIDSEAIPGAGTTFTETTVTPGSPNSIENVHRFPSTVIHSLPQPSGSPRNNTGILPYPVQPGFCRLLGIRNLDQFILIPDDNIVARYGPTGGTLANAPAIGSCVNFTILYGSVQGNFLCGSSQNIDSTSISSVGCDNCVPFIELLDLEWLNEEFGVAGKTPEEIEDILPLEFYEGYQQFLKSIGDTHANVTYEGRPLPSGIEGEPLSLKSKLIQVSPKTAWKPGEGVTMRITCGDDTRIERVIRAFSFPSAPRNVSAARNCDLGFGPFQEAEITWEPPLEDGGWPIELYEIRGVPDSGLVVVSASTFSYMAQSLLPLQYVFDVRARNRIGLGPPAFFTSGFIIGSPANLTVNREPCPGTEALLSWTAPPETECIYLSQYQIQFRVTGVGVYQTFGFTNRDITTAVVTGLTPENPYQFRVGRVAFDGSVSYSAVASLAATLCPP